MTNKKSYSCCFFGKIGTEITDELLDRIYFFINDLIIKGYNKFIFGTRTDFDKICLAVVNELKTIYKNIDIVAYVINGEGYILERDRDIFAKIYKCDKCIICTVDKEIEIKINNPFNKNVAIINNSDLCIFYFNDNQNNDFKNEYIYASKTSKVLNIFSIIN